MKGLNELLEYQLDEARSEINRHHRDFLAIQKLLDLYNEGKLTNSEVLLQIRNIVG